MSRDPDLDELIGADPPGAERERLRRTHELLLQAGPPPELPPELGTAPVVGFTLARQRRPRRRRGVLLLAAALAVAVAFAAGYAVAGHGGGSGGPPVAQTLALQATAAAPGAQATLDVQHARQGNRPMTLVVTGLPKLPPRSLYEVYLVRGGKPWASCGTFTVSDPSRALTLTLNAPYAPRSGDSWVVTREVPGKRHTAVLRTI